MAVARLRLECASEAVMVWLASAAHCPLSIGHRTDILCSLSARI